MVSIVISEKGGAERRERFETPEISIGRVKGNDVLLPKGNVSKRHARLIQRDGRFIVTDLKSTNGTYVNHRRITHATLVREGDRIYIGDFVLWIESNGAQAGAPGPDSAPPPDFHDGDSPITPDGYAPSGAVGLDSVSSSASFESRHEVRSDGVVSHFPIEHDPDESMPAQEVPAPPRVPHGLRHGATGSYPAIDVSASQELISSAPSGHLPTSPPGNEADSNPAGARRSSEPRPDRKKLEEQQAFFDQLIVGTERALGTGEPLEGAIPASAELRKKVEQALDQQLDQRMEAQPPPEGIAKDAYRAAALRELLELGSLGPLLEDEATSQVQIMLRRVVVTRRGRRRPDPGLGFSSERAVMRVVQRLCHVASEPVRDDELYVSRQLADGRRLFAVRPPASPRGHLVVVSKPQRSSVNLNTLVRSGTVSRGMATLLTHCVAARANVLVVGSVGSGVRRLVDALAAMIPQDDRTIWLSGGNDMDHVADRAAAIDLGESTESRLAAIEAAARLEPDHLIAPTLCGPCLATILDSVTQGTEGLIMYGHASTLRHAVGRLSADVAGARPGLSVDTAREWLLSAFDMGLEVARLRDSRQRVARLSEFRSGSKGGSLRDVFTFAYHRTATGGSIEGSFYATGTVPHIVDDLAARGMPLDTSIFRRHPTG